MTWHRWLMVAFSAAAVVLLWDEHELRLLEILPYLLLACPLLHLFGHRHRHHEG